MSQEAREALKARYLQQQDQKRQSALVAQRANFAHDLQQQIDLATITVSDMLSATLQSCKLEFEPTANLQQKYWDIFNENIKSLQVAVRDYSQITQSLLANPSGENCRPLLRRLNDQVAELHTFEAQFLGHEPFDLPNDHQLKLINNAAHKTLQAIMSTQDQINGEAIQIIDNMGIDRNLLESVNEQYVSLMVKHFEAAQDVASQAVLSPRKETEIDLMSQSRSSSEFWQSYQSDEDYKEEIFAPQNDDEALAYAISLSMMGH